MQYLCKLLIINLYFKKITSTILNNFAEKSRLIRNLLQISRILLNDWHAQGWFSEMNILGTVNVVCGLSSQHLFGQETEHSPLIFIVWQER